MKTLKNRILNAKTALMNIAVYRVRRFIKGISKKMLLDGRRIQKSPNGGIKFYYNESGDALRADHDGQETYSTFKLFTGFIRAALMAW